MDTEAIDVSQGSWNTALSEQVHQSVNPLRVVYVEVPEHGVVWYIGLRVSLVAPVHGGELDRIPNEEYGKIVEDEVLDALFGIELCCPASNIADRVAGPLFAADS